jgi:glycosyltransferase involved in cell wall biosynthesis
MGATPYFSPVRILLVDPVAYTLPYDDALAAALARRGHDVELVTSPSVFAEAPESVGYRRNQLFLPLSGRLFRHAPRSRLRRALAALEYGPGAVQLVRRARAFRPDVVHVQWTPRHALDLPWLRRLPSPRVFTAHNARPRDPRHVAARRDLFRLVDRIVVHSRGARGRAVELGAPPERVVVIPHGVWEPDAEPRPPEGRTLLFFGLIRPYKGLDVLVRALPEVPDARLVVAGDPFGSLDALRRLADGLGVDGRIEWRTEFVPEAEVPALFRSATAVVLPYHRGAEIDSSGVMALALGYGRPLVVSDVGALGEVVADFAAGRVVPPDDVSALARACVEVLDDPAAAFSGTQAARRALSWDSVAEAHERMYADIVARR